MMGLDASMYRLISIPTEKSAYGDEILNPIINK